MPSTGTAEIGTCEGCRSDWNETVDGLCPFCRYAEGEDR